jgi:CBS domain containing-hemolysin-like protein
MASGSRTQQLAVRLLSDPDRLLSAVLFWNLAINIAYFAIVSIVGIQLERHSAAGESVVVGFTFGSLLLIIFCSEMLPKSVAVLQAPALSSLVSVPVAAAVRLVDPVMPTLRLIMLLSRRLLCPGIQREPYLEVADLERAIEMSTSDAQLVRQEQTVLSNIVSLSDIRVEEWMRPRRQFLTFRPPVSLADLDGQLTPSGYLFVTEPESDEVVAALHLSSLSEVRLEHLEYDATPVVVVPWCATVADTLQQLQTTGRGAAVVVNELGETIGVISLQDILDTVFSERSGRSERLLNREPIQPLGPERWQVTGMTNVRRLARYFGVELPSSRSVTVGGIVHETLQRLPVAGDTCQWGPFEFRVVEAPESEPLLVHLTLLPDEEDPQ